MITFNNVSFSYGRTEEKQLFPAIKHVDLTVQAGECMILCGKSGHGKSTLLRLMNGLAPGFYEGQLEGGIKINGIPPNEMKAEVRAKEIGVVFQDPRSQFFMEKVKDELAFTAENLGVAPDDIHRKISIQAKLLKIEYLLQSSVNRLSSGEKQRVAIAAATLLSPSLLILDEPTANLDCESIATLLLILQDLKKRGTTIVISEHRVHSLLQIADHIVCISAGEIKKQWTAEEFIRLDYQKLKTYGLRHPEMTEQVAPFFLASSKPSTLQAENVTYSYKRKSLKTNNLSFQIKSGEVVGVLGKNGVGKTTLCKVLCGLYKEKTGVITYEGARLSKTKREKMSFFVMQDSDYQLYTDSVEHELQLGKRKTKQLQERIEEALQLFGLHDLRHRHPASLSGGEKQRVTLAVAYCSDAQLILLDESTSGLDGGNMLNVVEATRRLREMGKMILVITHDQAFVQLACQQTITIE
ncbi:ABC transporter [Bacillaceae bacterium SAS-127]|nr:ABC transporter [Bacillaceae bacterium SAS-127]